MACLAIVACSVGCYSTDSLLGHFSDEEVVTYARQKLGDLSSPDRVAERWLGSELIARVSRDGGASAVIMDHLGELVWWLSEDQLMALSELVDEALFMDAWPSARADSDTVAVANPEFCGEGAFDDIDGLDLADASSLFRMLEGNGNRAWPNDGDTMACRIALRYPGQIEAALRREVVEGSGFQSPYWAALSLVRLGKWDPGLVEQRQLPWHWGAIAPGRPGDEVYEAYVAVMSGQRKEVERMWAGRVPSLGTVSGVWMATIGDVMADPPEELWHVTVSEDALRLMLAGDNAGLIADALLLSDCADCGTYMRWHMACSRSERRHEYGKILRALKDAGCARALVALAEMGDGNACKELFWGVDNGVFAAGVALYSSPDLCETAWRSGRMLNMVRTALRRGGAWVGLAQKWLWHGNRDVLSLNQKEFERVARRVFLEGGDVIAMRCPLSSAWVIVPGEGCRPGRNPSPR